MVSALAFTPGVPPPEADGQVTHAYCSPVDGNYCLTCGSDKTLKLWNPLRGTLLRTYSGHGYEVLDAAGSFDNSHLCSGGGDKTVVLWDVATGQVVRKFRGHAGVSTSQKTLNVCIVEIIVADGWYEEDPPITVFPMHTQTATKHCLPSSFPRTSHLPYLYHVPLL